MEARARARWLADQKRADEGIRYFEAQEQQIPALQCRKRGCFIPGGNRGGKTVVGAAETVYRLLGRHPYKSVPRAPIKVWACSQDLPGTTDQPHKQLEELRRWIPKSELRGGEWSKAYSPMARVLTLANGSVVVFKGYDQDLLKFESDAIHWCWFDEEPGDKRIWTSCLLRLADYNGGWMMTATPVLSLQGKGWIEELWEHRANEVDYETHQLFSYQNPHLNNDTLDELFGNLTAEERAVRSRGAFARLGGRVLSEFDPDRHLVRPMPPEPEWRHYLIIDPGYRNAFAALWASVDRRGRIWLYAEYYVAEKRPDDHLPALHGLWQAYGRPNVTVIMDSAAWALNRTALGKESPSDYDELMDAARKIGATWFRPQRCKKNDPSAYRVKRYLAAGMLMVGENLKWWQWEAERWVYVREGQGPRDAERPVPEKPADRNNHLMDCTIYLCSELPDPIPDAPPPVPRTWELLAQQDRENLGKRGAPRNPLGSQW